MRYNGFSALMAVATFSTSSSFSVTSFTTKHQILKNEYEEKSRTISFHLHMQKKGITPRSSDIDCSVKKPQAWLVPENVKFGKLDRLELRDHTPSTILDQSDEVKTVTIATKAIGLNFADIFCVLGLYSAANEVRGSGKDSSSGPLGEFIPGLEFSGIVLNDESGNYQKGDAVLGFTRFGAYADILKVDPSFLKPLPSSWTFEEGSSFIVQALTAWHGLVEVGSMPKVIESSSNCDDENDNENENKDIPYIVLIHSAAGGVGLWASEIAARRGAIVIGVVGDEYKAETFYKRIKEISPLSKAMIRGKEKSFAKRLAKILHDIHMSSVSKTGLIDLPQELDLNYVTKQGYGTDLVMESLGGKYFKASFDSLNSGGALVTFGSTSYVSPGIGLGMLRLIYRYLTRPKIDPGQLTSRNIRLAGFNLIYLTERTTELRRQLNECISCLSGDIAMEPGSEITLDDVTPPIIGDTFDFRTEMIEAMTKLKSGKTVGKVVLSNRDNSF